MAEEFVNEEGWYQLAASVIKQAVDDYRIAVIVRDDRSIRSIERFFNSRYFHSISGLDPKWLVPKLKARFEQERQEREEQKKAKWK